MSEFKAKRKTDTSHKQGCIVHKQIEKIISTDYQKILSDVTMNHILHQGE